MMTLTLNMFDVDEKYVAIDVNIVVGGTIYGRDLTDCYSWALR